MPASMKEEKTPLALATSNGTFPRIMSLPSFAWRPLDFISAWRAAMGSDCAAATAMPNPIAMITQAAWIMELLPRMLVLLPFHPAAPESFRA